MGIRRFVKLTEDQRVGCDPCTQRACNKCSSWSERDIGFIFKAQPPEYSPPGSESNSKANALATMTTVINPKKGLMSFGICASSTPGTNVAEKGKMEGRALCAPPGVP
eukprot:2304426-Prymnesium_polylepis.1